MKRLETTMMPTVLLLAAACSGVLPVQETQEGAIELAKEAVAGLIEGNTDPSSIRVRRVGPVQWPDTSLGCPKEGMMYAQVITPGYRVFLDVERLTYQVHVGDGRAVICNDPFDRTGAKELPGKIPAENESGIDGEVPEAILDALRKDLGRRLGVEPGGLEIVEAESVTWNDGSLGCPKPGQMYTQATVEGYRVILEHRDKRYDYRADAKGRFSLCDAPSRTRPRPRQKQLYPGVTRPR